MPRILDLLEIDGQFESSVNLLLDREDIKKVQGYIPLASSIAVLKRYLVNVTENTSEKSTMLIGPYGKGKSHLLLVLSSILEGHESVDTYKNIKKADKEAGTLIENWTNKGRKMLTVVLSNTGEGLNQTFTMSLYSSLKRAGLENIMPDTYFSEAVKTIEGWKENFPDTYNKFKDCLGRENLNVNYFVKKLKGFDEKSLEKFKEIYPVLTSGSIFNPMINVPVLSLYAEINRVLCEKYGYSGMFVIFDEFSKYIEGNTKENVSTNMKIVQDFCELANHSRQYPLHVVFVAHKSIREYRDVLPEKVIQGFKGIEGRLKELLFVSSEKNNYGLIGHAVKKKEDAFEQNQELKDYVSSQLGSISLPCFNAMFDLQEFEASVIKGCYPIIPAAAYILFRISEKIGQNERTLFTYIAKSESGSMLRQLKGRQIGQEINCGDIYDYFEGLFCDNGALPAVHNEWLKADFALSKAEDDAEKSVLKSLALIHMVNRSEELPAGRDSLRYASGLSEKCFEKAVEGLVKKQLIIYRERTREYSFMNNIGIDLFAEVRNTATESFSKINIIKELKNIIELKYLFPRKYNVDFTMTRFFEYAFINTESFFAIEKAGVLFDKSVSDGRVVVLMDGADVKEEEILSKLRSWNDPRIMAVKPYGSFKKEQSIKNLLAVRKLLADERFTENNKALIQEMSFYEEDLLYEINTEIAKMASPVLGGCSLITLEECFMGGVSNRQFNKILSDTCKVSYKNAPKINNEQINRRLLTKQIRKARGNIIKSILNNESFSQYDDGKSPEAAIFRAVFYGTGIVGRLPEADLGTQKVLEAIKDFIKDCGGKKQCFGKLYDQLEGLGYGVRRGVIPILLAYVFSEFEDMPFVYLNDREVVLDEDCLGRVNDTPENYYLFVEESTAKKNEYIKALEDIFVGTERRSDGKQGEKPALIVEAAKRWYRGLAQYTMKVKEDEWKLYCGEENISYKEFDNVRKIFKKLELNPREIIFEKLPNVFGCKGICDSEGLQRLVKIKLCMENFIDRVKNAIALEISSIFDENGGNLNVVLKAWYEKLPDRAVNGLYPARQQELLKTVAGLKGCDAIKAAELMAKAATGVYIEDWSENGRNDCINSIRQFYKDITEVSETAKKGETTEHALIMREAGNDKVCYYNKVDESSTGIFLRNAIEDVINEFGDGIDESGKISVLVDLLKSITGGEL